MPTVLPTRRRAIATAVPQKKSLATILLNTFMVVSALALTFIVLLTEERYAYGPVYDQMTIEQTAEQITEQAKAP